jgi:peroxiredoxin
MLGERALAPDFTLPDMHGAERTLDEALSNGPAVLVFYKISCPVCQLTLPFLERLYKDRFPVFGISQDDAAASRKFSEKYGLTFPMLIDDQPANYPVSNAFKISSVPSMFLVEKDHTISWALSGFGRKELEDLGHRLHTNIFRTDDRVPEYKPG